MDVKTMGIMLGSVATVVGFAYLSKSSQSHSETCASCGAEGECGCKAFSRSFGEVVDFGERRRRQQAESTISKATTDIADAVDVWNREVEFIQKEMAEDPKPNRSLLRRARSENGNTGRMVQEDFHRLMGYQSVQDVPLTLPEDLDLEELAISFRYASLCAKDAALFYGATIDDEKVFENPKVREALSTDLGRTDDYKKLLCMAMRDAVSASSKFATLSALFYTMHAGPDSLGRKLMLQEVFRMDKAADLISSQCDGGSLGKAAPPKTTPKIRRRKLGGIRL